MEEDEDTDVHTLRVQNKSTLTALSTDMTTDVDLSNYLQTSDIISITNGEIDTIVTTADMDSNS